MEISSEGAKRKDAEHLLIKGAILGLIATNLSLLVAQGSVSFSYLVRGFPVPYLTFNGCEFYICEFDGSQVRPIPSFYIQYALADFAIWLVIAIGILLMLSSMNTRKRSSIFLGVGLASGLGITLLSVLLRPLSLYTPIVGMESYVNYMGGFPLEYFERATIFLLSQNPPTISYFTTINFVTDCVLWSLASLAVIGFITSIFSRRLPSDTHSPPVDITIAEMQKL